MLSFDLRYRNAFESLLRGAAFVLLFAVRQQTLCKTIWIFDDGSAALNIPGTV